MAGEDMTRNRREMVQKSYFDVLGLCCSSEVPLVERILKAIEGVQEVSVIVPSRTVIVVHDNLLVSQTDIVKALNKARLEASIQVYGEKKKGLMWPSKWTVACGVLLLVSVFKMLYHPLHWLAVGAAIVGLPPILMRSIVAIRNRTLDINILVLIAVGGSIALKDYWEAGSIVFLFTIAEWLESRAGHKAKSEMASLMSMAPQKAVLADGGVVVDAKDVEVNTLLAVKAGEAIPIDGVVVDGTSEVDERTLTGESFPVAKHAQSVVWAGTINLIGYIRIRTTTTAQESAVARMAKLVEEAQNKKSRTQRFIDKCAIYYTPTVVVIAAGVALVPLALKAHNLSHWFHLALVILVSACPCALILSTPVATFCALTNAAKTGILIKGGDYLQDLAKLRVVAFDKTGTITKGEFVVTEFGLLTSHLSLPTLLSWVSSIESKSSHPMAQALVEYSQSNGIEPDPEKVEDFCTFPGEGICGKIDEKQVYIGNKRMASRAACQTVPAMKEGKDGCTEGYVFVDGTCIGVFKLSDVCRTGVSGALVELKSMGIKTAMLTGDNHAAAMNVHNQLGHTIDEVHAELLPEAKVRLIQDLKKSGPTAMVGDGMNDAPALAAADVGISMGVSGSGVAIETGHITLMSNDIRKIPQAIHLARRTWRRVVENIVLSVATKAGILALAFAGHPLLWAAVGADVGTCIVVIFNSMRLLGTTTATNNPSSHCHHDHSTTRHGHDHGCYGRRKGKCSGGHHHHGRPSEGDTMKESLMHDKGCAQMHGLAETRHCCSHDHEELETHCCSHGHSSPKGMEEEDHNMNQVSVICDIETGHEVEVDVHGHQDHLNSTCANHTCCSH